MKPGGSFCPARGPDCSPTWCIICSSQIICCTSCKISSTVCRYWPSYKIRGSFATFFHSGPTLTFAVLFFSKTTDWSTIYRAWLYTPAPLPQRETTRRSRRLRGQRPLSPKSPPAEVVGSAATPPSGGSPLSGAQPPSLHLCFFQVHNVFHIAHSM